MAPEGSTKFEEETGIPISSQETNPPRRSFIILDNIYPITEGESPVEYEIIIKNSASSESKDSHNLIKSNNIYKKR